MRIDRITIKNIGPFNDLDLRLNGKSVTFVGENGSGKTLLLSSIVDFVYEHFRGIGFRDVMKTNGNVYDYFRITSSTFLNNPKQNGLIWISGKINNQDIYYLEKYGYDDKKDISKELDLSDELIPWPNEGSSKAINTISGEKQKNDARNHIRNTPVLFLPATRFENESWKTDKYFNIDLSIDGPTSSSLGRPVELYKSFKDNYIWLVNMLFNYSSFTDYKVVFEERLKTINGILSDLLGKNVSIRLCPDYNSRLVIADNDNVPIVRSLGYLSLGQMSVLNILINVIRYSRESKIRDIEGLVVIDEIDAHLTGSYKTSVLPKIIKLFPEVQFIITTHDPLSVVGLEECGENKLIELPSGKEILAKNFSEVKIARESLKKRNNELHRIVNSISNSSKPVIIVEDEHLKIYKVAWLKLNRVDFNIENIDEKFEIMCPFNIVSANGHLNLYAFLSMNNMPDNIADKRMVGLFDFDDAFCSFNGLNSNIWSKIVGQERTGLYRHNELISNIYAMVLPIPYQRKSLACLEYGDNSTLSIELYFSNKLLGNHCVIDDKKPGKIVKFSGNKATFWKECSRYDVSCFNNFKPLFETIYKLLDI